LMSICCVYSRCVELYARSYQQAYNYFEWFFHIQQEFIHRGGISSPCLKPGDSSLSPVEFASYPAEREAAYSS